MQGDTHGPVYYQMKIMSCLAILIIIQGRGMVLENDTEIQFTNFLLKNRAFFWEFIKNWYLQIKKIKYVLT